ncbi:MAG: hypothetical protein HY549_08465 [Elusimicrobia bacterium]|nr:hypothetical protein [Elusimicrobiota bacterium]
MQEGERTSFRALLAHSARTLFQPGKAFEELAQDQSPSYLGMAAAFSILAALALAIDWLRVVSGGVPAWEAACMGGALWMAMLSLSWPASWLLHALALGAGGQAPVARAYALICSLGWLLPLGAASGWLAGNAAPALLLGTCFLGMGLEAAYRARPLPSRLATLMLAAIGLLAGPYLGTSWIGRSLSWRAAWIMASSLSRTPDLPVTLEQPAAHPGSPALESDRASGLDMIRPPAAAPGTYRPPAPSRRLARAEGELLSLIDASLPALDHPNLSRLTPEQAKQVRKIRALLSQLHGQLNKNRPMTAQERAKIMLQYREMADELLRSLQEGAGAKETKKR